MSQGDIILFNKIISSFNEYELKARIFPASLTILPFVITILLWFPQIISLESSLLISIISIIILFFLGKLAREKGKKVQSKLIQKWGSLPATLQLSHLDNTIDIETKKRYHDYLQKNIEGLKLPSRSEEIKNPKSSRNKYESAVKWLIENTRDTKKFPLLYQDNINYGYSRNMLGLKWLGMIISIFSLALNFYLLYSLNYKSIDKVNVNIIISISINSFIIIIWTFFVNEKWVKSTAEAYARTLLSTCEKSLES